MEFIKTTSPVIDLIFGLIFSLIGMIIIVNRKKIIGALILSTKVFWGKLNFFQPKEFGIFLTNLMVPIIGVVFLVIGLLLIYKFMNFLQR